MFMVDKRVDRIISYLKPLHPCHYIICLGNSATFHFTFNFFVSKNNKVIYFRFDKIYLFFEAVQINTLSSEVSDGLQCLSSRLIF